MRGIISSSAAALLVLVLLATSVAPVFAAPPLFRCELGSELNASILAASQEIDFYERNYDATCIRIDPVSGEAG